MNRFPKERRLNTKKEFDQVFDHAKKLVLSNFIFFFKRNREASNSRLGLIIPKKKIAKAHDRNRIKRLVRESFRLSNVSALDIVVLARKELRSLDNQSLIEEVKQAWKKIEHA